MNQKSLFDDDQCSHSSVPRARHNAPETSHAAADSMKKSASRLRDAVYQKIWEVGGATCAEIEDYLCMQHQTASARITELRREGRIKDSGGRRKTPSGRKAIVWTVASS